MTSDNNNNGFKNWTVAEWVVLVGVVTTSIIGIINALVGNPVGVPGMG